MDSWNWIDSHGSLWARDDADGGFNNGMGTGNEFGGSSRGEFAFQSNDTSRSALINQFRFQTAKSIRTSTIILASFNVVAAFATAVGIIWDSYAAKKREDPKFRLRTSGFTFISPPDTFPLVMSFGITVQGIVFAGAQSTGLGSMFTLGCTVTSQLMFPAVFIVPYIQFIFGLEMALRAVRKQPFVPRGKWTVTGCIAILGALLLITFLVSHFIQPPSFCLPSLFWFLQRWKDGIFVLLIIIAAVLLICTVVIFWRLHSCCSRIDDTERDAASRMVYYLAIGVIPIGLTIPFFYSLVFWDLRTAGGKPLNFSMIASVVVNLSGLTTGGLHLLLRANCISAIGAANKCEDDRKKLKGGIRVWSPNGYENLDRSTYNGGSPGRLNGASSPRFEKEEEERVESPAGTPTYESPNPLRSQDMGLRSPRIDMPESPRPSRMEALKTHIRKSSYSLFPRENGTKSFGLLPATTYTPDGTMNLPSSGEDTSSLVPPPLVFGGGVRHRRTSSIGSHLSHATVQIGIRFSNAEEAPRIDSSYMAKVHDLGCPLEREKNASKRPSPLGGTPSEATDEDGTLVASNYGEAPTKSLPPLPDARDSQPLTLTAAVYSPGSTSLTRVTSPKGVGFAETPKRSDSASPRQRCYKDNCDCEGLHRHEWI